VTNDYHLQLQKITRSYQLIFFHDTKTIAEFMIRTNAAVSTPTTRRVIYLINISLNIIEDEFSPSCGKLGANRI